MDDKLKIELLKYNISRFDHYYASINFKSSFLVLANITLLGFLLTSNDIAFSSFLLCTVISILTIIFVLLAIKPFLKSYSGSSSVLYFEDINNSSSTEFINKISKITNEDYINDLQGQNFILSQGLTNKFKWLNRATISFIINLAIFIILLLFCK